MHIEARLFEFLTAFFALCAVGYATLTALYANGGVEWAGTTALVLTTGLTLITGTFFRFVARRLDTRPEDYEDAEIADGAGELGFFSPGSYWPFALALSVGLMGLALAFWYSWLIIIAAVALMITIGGLLFEYYVGQNASHSNAPHS